MRSLTLVSIVAVVAQAGVVHAEPRRTTAKVTLRAKPGERQAAVITVPAGAVVEVLEEQGRWLKVRVGKGGKAKVGWLTRTTVSAPAAATAPPTTPPPSAAWDEGAGDAAASAPRAATETATTATATTATVLAPAVRARAVTVRAGAGAGYRSLAMDFRSNSGGGLSSYVISADAAVADVEVEVVARPRGGRVVVAVDGRARFSYSSPGLDYMGPSLPPGEIPFSVFEGDGGLRAGYHRGPLDASLRAGLHYGAFLTDEVANAGRLPRERLRGVTAGIRVDVAPPRSRIRASASFDRLMVGDRRQTPGLEDGTSSDAGGLWVGAALHYQLRRRLSVHGALSFARATTQWQGASTRLPGATAAERVDQSQIIQVGVAAEL